jgi:general secretion pathway protein D
MERSVAQRWGGVLTCGAVVLAVFASCTTRGTSPRSSLPAQRAEPLVQRQPPVLPSAAPPPPTQVPPPSAREPAPRTRPDASDDGRQRTRPSTDAARSIPPAGRDGLVALDFDRADITAVIQTVSEIVGFNYILAPEVQGTVTVRTIGQISRSDLFDVFRAILDVHGFTAVQDGDVYKIVRRDGARARAVPTVIGSFTDRTRPGDEVITQIVPVPSPAAAELVGLLQPLISKDGQLIARPDERLLVIIETVSNVARLLDVISRVDRETLGESIHVIPVRFADAATLATILNQRAQRLAAASSGGSPALVIADRRSNSLVVQAHGAELEAIRRLITGLDVSLPGRRLFFYFAEHARAKQLAATLTAIHGEAQGQPVATDVERTVHPARIVADETTNGLIVMTSSQAWPDIEASIKALDHRPRQVRIETLVADITLTEQSQWGVDWAATIGHATLVSLTSTTSPALPGVAASQIVIPSTITLPRPGLTALTVNADAAIALLNAFASEQRVVLAANPSVVVSENQKAVFNVSDSVPIVTSVQTPVGGTATAGPNLTTAIVGTQSIEYRDVGIVLTVTPRIGERGTVVLDVKQEVNDLGAPEPPTGSPRITKREVETAVVVGDNETLVLGGQIRDRRATSHRGIPFLKDIPILGTGFGTKTNTIEKSELLILITPRVVPAGSTTSSPASPVPSPLAPPK